MDSTTCKVCDKNFSRRSNLRAHIRNFHSGQLEELAPLKTFKCSAVCKECNKTFARYSNLTLHIRKYHKDKLTELIKPRNYSYTCETCKKHFTNLRSFKHHNKSIHNEKNNRFVKCILCKTNSDAEYFTKTDLLQHFGKIHNVNICTRMLEFASLQEFETWKRQEENETNELFVNAHGTYTIKNMFKRKYYCHRSGFYRSKGNNIRQLKTQGSKKINGYCPASISVKANNDKFEVQYVSTHVGHSNNLRHLNLTKRERQVLAVHISEKIPFENILDRVRESDNGTLKRLNLLTKKDLFNIEKSFNLRDETPRHHNDATVDVNMDIHEEIPIVNVLSKTKLNRYNEEFSTEKANFQVKMVQLIDSLASFEELDIAKKAVASLLPTLTAFRNFNSKEVYKKLDKNLICNKKISQPRRPLKTEPTEQQLIGKNSYRNQTVIK